MNADLPANESGHCTAFHHSQTQTHTNANSLLHIHTHSHSFKEPQNTTELPPSFLMSAVHQRRALPTFLHPPYSPTNAQYSCLTSGMTGVQEEGKPSWTFSSQHGQYPIYRWHSPPPFLGAHLFPLLKTWIPWHVVEEESWEPELLGSFLTHLVLSLNPGAQ